MYRIVAIKWIPFQTLYKGKKGKGIPNAGHESPRRMWKQGSTYTQPRHKEEVGWLVLRSADFNPGESPSTHFIGGWVDSRTSLDARSKDKFPPLRYPGSTPSRPERSQAPSRLSWLASFHTLYSQQNFWGMATNRSRDLWNGSQTW